MVVKFEITMTNKWLYSLIAVGIFLALGVGVLAYNSDMRVGNPPVIGHSAGEINVENSTGGIVNLQEAFNEVHNSLNNIISRDGEHRNCVWTGYVNNWDAVLSYTCPNGKYIAGLYSIHDNYREDRLWKVRCCS